MEEDIQKIYNLLSKISVFKNMPQCKTCDSACGAPRWSSWLLPEEAERLEKEQGLSVIKIKGVNFLKDGPCKLYKNGMGCTIYNRRPLECRLSPITIIKSGKDLWWALQVYCPIVGKANKDELEKIKSKVKEYVEKVEKLLTPKIKKDLLDIENAVNAAETLVENVDYIKVKKLQS